MEDAKLQIYDLMACNVYWDFENSMMPKETHKMLVVLYPTPGIVAPDLIQEINAYGPDGYEVSFANQKFDNKNFNGWFYTPEMQNYWYMVNLPTGFLKEGEYRIEITCKDGDSLEISRVQSNGPSDAVLEAYLKNRDAILESYAPSKSNPLGRDASLENVEICWSTLKDVAGLDAFYVTRLAKASKPIEFDGNNLTYFDNIYYERLANGDVLAGRNRNRVVVEKDLESQTDYGYFVEITDANVGGQANVCVFQPHQFFKTP